MSANTVQFTASDTLVHHTYSLKRGDTVPMPKGVADDLKAAGLGTYTEPAVKEAPAPENKMMPDAAAPAPTAKTVAPHKTK